MASDSGHGHVHPAPNGVRARCGGPAFCDACAGDLEGVIVESLARMFLDILQTLQPASVAPYGRRKLVELGTRALAELDALDDAPSALQAVGPLHRQALIHLERLGEALGQMVTTHPAGDFTVGDTFAVASHAIRASIESHWQYLVTTMMLKPGEVLVEFVHGVQVQDE